jgi:hypothetical protein
MPHNGRMAAKKRPDRHKPSRMVRLKERLAQQLDLLAGRNETSISHEVNQAVREKLQREGLWPPPGQAPAG